MIKLLVMITIVLCLLGILSVFVRNTIRELVLILLTRKYDE